MEMVGVPKEIKTAEKRVALTPAGVRVLSTRGVRVLVEHDAGREAGFTDEAYRAQGAELAANAAEVWKRAGLIKKVKEPLSSEFGLLRKDQMVFSFFHLASREQCALVKALVDARTTAMAYETISVQGFTPVLKPMSVAAGILAAYFAGVYRNLAEISHGQVQLSPTTQDVIHRMVERYPDPPAGFPPGRVVVLGGGQAGLSAAQMAVQMAGQVSIVESSPKRRQYLTVYARDHHLSMLIQDAAKDYVDLLYDADVIIGAVHAVGQRAPVIVSKELLREISDGHRKLIIDIAIDQGGNIAESRATTYELPLFLDSCGNIRFGVTNMPSLCPRQTSELLEQATLDYTLALAEGLDRALGKYPELEGAINVRDGSILNVHVAEAHAYR